MCHDQKILTVHIQHRGQAAGGPSIHFIQQKQRDHQAGIQFVDNIALYIEQIGISRLLLLLR